MHRGYTPLDLCTLRMQNLRDIAGIVGTFTAHSDSFWAVAQYLAEVGLQQGVPPSIPTYKTQAGCTCGQCKGGFLSPRMLHR